MGQSIYTLNSLSLRNLIKQKDNNPHYPNEDHGGHTGVIDTKVFFFT